MIPEKGFQQILILSGRGEVFAVDYEAPHRQVFIRERTTPRLWPAEHRPKCHGQSVADDDPVPERRVPVVGVGAAEMNRKKGRHHRPGFVELLAQRVRFATEGKDATIRAALATARLAHNGQPTAVAPVAIGRSQACRTGVAENFGNANIAFDKFLSFDKSHVVGQARCWRPWGRSPGMGRKHLAGSLGHWKAGQTTAFLAGLNSLFSATKRQARGCRSTEHVIAMLYLVVGKLSIPCY